MKQQTNVTQLFKAFDPAYLQRVVSDFSQKKIFRKKQHTKSNTNSM
jgi:hypothetical protein